MSRKAKHLWDLLGFFLLAAWFGLLNGWKPLGLLLLAAAVHELGHCLALAAVGGSVRGFSLSPLGARIETDSLNLSYPRELLAVLAGPMADLICAGGLCALARREEPLYAAAGAFWVLGIFNLLPLRALDGGRALELAAQWLAGPQRGERLACTVSLAAAVLLTGALWTLMLATGGNLWLLPAACGAAAAAAGEGKLCLRGQFRGKRCRFQR